MATLMYVRTLACPPPSARDAAAGGESAMSRLLGDQVDDGEDRDPDDVHEVPVAAGDPPLGLGPAVGAAPPGERDQDQEPDHAPADVCAVEAGKHEEARAEEAGRQLEPVVERERSELVHLVE